MGRMKKILALGLLTSVLSLSVSTTRAGAEIGYGRFTFLPQLALQETYRSNLYLTSSDRKSDFVTTVTPGMGLRYLFGNNSMFSLDYKVGFLNFARYSSNNYQDHRANGLLHWVASGGLEFTLGDSFTRSTLERVQTMVREEPFTENFFNGAAAYRFTDRWKVEGKYIRDDTAYDSSQFNLADYTSNLYGTSLYYRFLPRTSGLVEYDYVIKSFPNDRLVDQTQHLAYAGLAFDPAGKLKGSLKAGYGWQEFNTSVQGRDNSPRNWIMAVQVVDDFDSRTSATLDALRAFATDATLVNASYINTWATLTLQHFFTGKIGAVGVVSYRERDYTENLLDPGTGTLGKRTDKIWTSGVGGFYNIQKWLQVRLEYQYQDSNSNFSQYSYVDHRVSLRMVLSP